MFDALLIGGLVLGLPAFGFWRTWAQQRAGRQIPRIRRYAQSLALAIGLSIVVIGEWALTGRDWRALGLGLPLAGWIGLGVAVVVLVALAAAMKARERKNGPSQDAAAADMLPVTPAETKMFVLFSLGIGFGWELLYRGYLMWVLPQHVGLVGAVLLAAGAYGVAHGYRGAKPFIGSLASALIFTLAYVLTHSLWWLVVIHAGLPLLALSVTRSSPAPSTDTAQTQAA